MLEKLLLQQNHVGVGRPTMCSAFKSLSHANTYDSNEAYTQWICLPPAVDVVRKRKTIQFTVICVMITIVQKIVILKSMLDLGRSFSYRLLGCFPSVIQHFRVPSNRQNNTAMTIF